MSGSKRRLRGRVLVGFRRSVRTFRENKEVEAQHLPRNIRPREVEVGTFEIDETEVTNQQFAQFVVAENYITDAEIYGFSFV